MPVTQLLRFLVAEVWPLPPKLQVRVVRALHTSPCSRAATVRHHLALATICDLDNLFCAVLTPRFLAQLVEDVVSTGALTRAEGSAVEEAFLAGVDASGRCNRRPRASSGVAEITQSPGMMRWSNASRAASSA